MASSSHSQNLTSKEIIYHVTNPETQNIEALHQEREQSPVIISLIKKLRTAKNLDQVSEESKISFKLPRGCLTADIFKIAEEKDTQGCIRHMLRSKPINFMLPDDCVEHICHLDEEAKATRGGNHLSLLERLKGWKIEKRQRDNTGRFDNAREYFYHIKSQGRFRSFIEVETFIIHCRFPRDWKPEEGSSAVEPVEPGSSKQALLKRRTRKSLNNTAEKKRLTAKKILREARRNLNSSTRIEDAPSSASINDEARVTENLDEQPYNIINGLNPEENDKITSDQDFDEEIAWLILDFKYSMENRNPQI